jgi:hypothetical protein
MSNRSELKGITLTVIVVAAIVVGGAVFYRFVYVTSIAPPPVQVCGDSSEDVYIWTGTVSNGEVVHYTLVEEVFPSQGEGWMSLHSYPVGSMLYFTNFDSQPLNPLTVTVAEPSIGSCFNVGSFFNLR